MLSSPQFPATLSHSKNPILVSVETDIGSEPNAKVILAITADGIVPIILESDIDSDNKGSWEISKVLNQLLLANISKSVPEIDADFIEDNSTSLSYAIVLFEVFGDIAEIHFDSSIPSDPLTVMYGGLSDEVYLPELFWDYRDSKSPELPFLTWCPNVKRIRPESPQFISYLPDQLSTAKLNIEIYEYETDAPLGAFAIYDGTACEPLKMLTFNLNPFHLGLMDLDDKIGRFIIQLVGLVENVEEGTTEEIAISEEREYLIDYDSAKATRDFHFINSIAGKDSLTTEGEITSTPEYEAVEKLSYKLPNFYENLKGTTQLTDQKETWNEKINSGYLTKQEADWYRDFLLSTHRYVFKNNKWIPIKITSKKIEYQEPAELYFVSFEYYYQYQNSIYTPNPLIIE